MLLTIPRAVNAKYFLVRIDKEKQRKKREALENGLYLHPNQVFLTRNQQCGEVVRIGRDAAKYFPQVWIGDTLLFHHSIEGSLDDRGGDKRQAYENTKFLLLEDDTYKYYIVHLEQTYGVEKIDGSIVTAPNWLFCKEYEKPKPDGVFIDDSGRELYESAGGLVLFADYEQTVDEKRTQIKSLEAQIKSLSKSGVGEMEGLSKEKNKERSEVQTAIADRMQQMQKLTSSINHKNVNQFTLLYGNPTFDRDCNAKIDSTYKIFYHMIGNNVATINYNDKSFCLLKTSQIFYIEKPTHNYDTAS